MRVIDLVLIPLLVTISVVSELALSFIPNVQLTFLLFILYSKTLKTRSACIIVVLHVFFDCLIAGSMIPFIMMPMIIGYMIIPLVMRFIKTDNSIFLGLFAILFSLLYCWCFIPFNVIFYDVEFLHYLLLDIPFEIILMVSSFISVMWLYPPLKKVFDEQMEKFNEK